MDKHIKEINEEIKKATRRIENIGKKYDELQEKYKAKKQEYEQLRGELCITEENLKDYIEHYNRQCEQLDQLKAKEQECEELRSKNNYSPEVLKQCPHYKNDNICTYLGYETKCEGDCNYTTFQDFIAEIDDLKNVNSKLQQQLDQLKAENEELKRLIAKQKNAKIQLSKLKDKQYKEFCDMKQTLQEIKEIVHGCLMSATRQKILQKISECEGKDD